MKTIDLFAGCGGLSLGFQNAGFEIQAAFDYWKPALDVYQANFNHQVFNLDLSQDIDISTFTQFFPQMIIGGAPCQDFSSAGKRDETLGRANLSVKFAEIILAIKPDMFVMENVPRIEKSLVYQKCLKIFRESDYGLTAKILDASFCNVPQTRKRFFLIGKLNAEDGFLNSYLEQNLSKKPLTVFDYLGESLDIEFYYRHPRSYQRRGIFSVHEPSPTIRGVNRPIPKTYIQHSTDACAPDENVRPLTTQERAQIQTFPENFNFFGSKTDLEQMIGNAVPVKMAEFLANSIQQYIGNNQINLAQKPIQLAFHF